MALEADARTIGDVHLAYANTLPTVVRAREAEAVLEGKTLTGEGLAATAKACNPRISWRANRHAFRNAGTPQVEPRQML